MSMYKFAGTTILLFFVSSVAYGLEDLTSIERKITAVAELCDGNCRTTCESAAQQVRSLAVSGGAGSEASNAVNSCYMAAFGHPATAGNPAVTKLLPAMMSLNKISGAQTSGSKSPYNAQVPGVVNNQSQVAASQTAEAEVDTNYRDADGNIDMAKVIAMYDAFPALCNSISADSFGTTMCNMNCGNEKQNLQSSFEIYIETKAQLKAVTDPKVEQRLQGQQGTMEFNIKNTLEKSSCLSKLASSIKAKGIAEPQVYSALVSAVAAVNAGEWPPEEALSLDLDLGLTDAAPTADGVIANIQAVDAPAKLSFKDAQEQLKALPEYAALETQVKKNRYSLAQLQAAMTKLEAQKATAPANKWNAKALEIGEAGLQRELYDALNQSCNLAYLEAFKEPTAWVLPNIRPSFGGSAPPQAKQLEFRMPVIFLQRLCFEEQVAAMKPSMDKANNEEELRATVASYLALAPEKPGPNCKGCAPRRIMNESQWQPGWQAYLDSRMGEFKAKQQALAAKQAAEAKEAARKSAIARAEKQQQDMVNAEKQMKRFANKDYSNVLDIRQVKTRMARKNENIPMLRKDIKSLADFSRQTLKLADRQFMLDGVRSGGNYADQIQIKNRASLSAMTSCIGLEDRMSRFLNDPYSISGEEFIPMPQLLDRCNKLVNLTKAQLGRLKSFARLIADIETNLQNRAVAQGVKFDSNPTTGNSLKSIGSRETKALTDKTFAQITGMTPSQAKAGLQQRMKQLRQQSAGKPLPAGNFTYSALEKHIIASHVAANGWDCPRLTPKVPIPETRSFAGTLLQCAERFGGGAFNQFAKNYQLKSFELYK